MDFPTQQLIAKANSLLNKLAALHADLTQLRSSLDQMVHAINKQTETAQEQHDSEPRRLQVEVSDFRSQIPLRVETEPKKHWYVITGKSIKGFFEIIGIAAAVALAFFAWQTLKVYVNQWEAMIDGANAAFRSAEYSRKQLNEAVQNFRTDERGWVGITTIQGSPEHDKKFVTTIIFSNVGKTPAISLDVLTAFDVAKWDEKLTERRVIPRRNAKNVQERYFGLLHPGQPMVAQAIGLRGDVYIYLTEQQSLQTLLYGRVNYSDIFRARHYTNFCYVLAKRPQHKPGAVATYFWTPCAVGNYPDPISE